MAAPTNTKKDRQKIKDQADAAALKAEEMSKAGGIPMDGLSPTGVPESTIGMSKSEKFFSQGRALDQMQREGYKTFGDKATGEGINKLRALQGRPAISNTPKEFSENINKSVGFGSQSALLDQAGRDRALKGGIGAGLSYEEADAAVSKAYDFLKKKYGDKTTPTTPTTLDGSGNDPRVDVIPPTNVPPLTLPPEVSVEKGPVMQFFDDVLTGGSGPRALVKGGSLILKGTGEAAAKAATEAAAKAAGATGDAAKTAGGVVDDAAKVVGKAGDAGARMRETQAGKAAGAVDEAAGATDEAAAAAGKGKGLFSKLAEGAAKSQLGRGALAATRVGGKGLRLAGRAAGPALEIYDAGRYFTGDQEVKDQYLEDAATLGQRVFQPKSFGEFAGGVGDVLSPTKNVLGTYEGVKQLLKSQDEARGAEASAKHAENVIKAKNDRRRELYPDEVFNKLPIETRRKISQAIRKEFADAGVVTYGKFQ